MPIIVSDPAASDPASYTDLQTEVLAWLQRANVSFNGTEYVTDFILKGEKYIFRHARTRDMEAALSVAIASGVMALPADFVALKYAYIDGTPVQPLQMRSASWIVNKYPTRSSEDKPLYCAIDGSNLIFGPYPDSTYTVKGTYYKRLASISSSANALFTANPDLYLFAALAEAKAFMKDDTHIQLWTSKRDQILADVNAEDKIATYSGGPLSMTVG